MDESKSYSLNVYSSIQSEHFNKSSLLLKKYVERKKFDPERTLFMKKYSTLQPIDDIVHQLAQKCRQIKIKDTFNQLYQRVQTKQQQANNRQLHKKMYSQDFSSRKFSILNMIEGVTQSTEKHKNYHSKSIVNTRKQKNTKRLLQINSIISQPAPKQRQNSVKMILTKTRHKTILDPIKKPHGKLSNNIRDYLHVEKISMAQLQQTLTNKSRQHLDKIQSPESINFGQTLQIPSFQKNISEKCTSTKKKFKIPFQTYYYLDFLWKVQLSNSLFITFPTQYEKKIKIYIGKGNNYRLVQSILKRRPWFIITDKIQQANFVWTQIKSTAFMNIQKKQSRVIQTKRIQYLQKGILTKDQTEYYRNYFQIHQIGECKMKQNMVFRNRTLSVYPKSIKQLEPIRMHNHFKNNFIIGNKKALFQTMSAYYSLNNEQIFNYLPLTFHIKNGIEDDQYLHFLKYYYAEAKQIKKDPTSKSYNAWIVKPGQNTNRGNGIIMCLTLQSIKNILKTRQKHPDGTYKTYIVQRYIQRPLLYQRRKFDLRHYIMITCLNGHIKGYWCRYGYVRTTSSQYTLKLSSGSIHLTNDAVQKQLPDYGKFEKGNKISYQQLQLYLQKCNYKINFWNSIYPKMKKIATDSIRACANNLDPDRKRNFQIFGLDFMIDDSFNVWLIEINTNPCLQLSCPLLGRIIPTMLHDAFEISIDSIFTPVVGFRPKNQIFYRNSSQQNSFELVFDERQDRVQISSIIDSNLQQEEQDIFEDDGEDYED